MPNPDPGPGPGPTTVLTSPIGDDADALGEPQV